MTEEEKLQLFNDAIDVAWEGNDKDNKFQRLIDNGLEVDRLDEFEISLAERAIFAIINFDVLHALWKANATPTSLYVQEIFDAFKSGKTVAEYYEEEEQKRQLKQAKDITKDFSAQKLKVDSANFEITEDIEDIQDSEIILNIKLKPFMFDGHFTETELEFAGFCNSKIQASVFSKEGYIFKEDEIEPSSIYIQSAHNPIDLRKLTIKQGRKYLNMKAELLFDFEYERTDFRNETVVWEFKIEKAS